VILVIPAVYLARNPRPIYRYLAAPIMGIAVLGMYLVSMSGFEIVPQQGDVDYFTGALTQPVMLMIAGLSVFIFTLLSLALGLSQSDANLGAQADSSDGADKIEKVRQEIRRRHESLREADKT
jgi:NO-binding membrane sensor protein with MHYT domain